MTLALFVELLIKSALVAGIGLAVSALMERRPARERVDILRVTLVLLLALPVAVLMVPGLSVSVLAPEPAVVGSAAPLPVQTLNEPWAVNLDPVVPVAISGAVPGESLWILAAAALYLTVALALLGRLVLGTVTLARWSREGRPVAAGAWARTLDRLGPGGVRLVASTRIASPLSWGLPPGVVLITPDSLHREDQALAVLAHELAHIRRRDWLFLALSWLVVALFWFNPLVWWLHRALAARTEEAADAAALSEIDPQTYARTLLDLASEPAWPAALAIGDDFNTLKKRIARIMSDKPALPPRPVALAVAVGALIAVATPLAAIELTHRRADPVAPAAQERQASAAAPERPVAEAPTPGASDGQGSMQVVIDGQPVAWADLSPEQRREIEADIANAAAEAAEAESDARLAAADAEQAARDAAEARIDAEAISREAEAAARYAEAAALEAGTMAIDAARMARESLAKAAVDMQDAARDMRTEGERLRNPAYRARLISEHRGRGETLTDAHLLSLSRTLTDQAGTMEAQSRDLRRQSRETR